MTPTNELRWVERTHRQPYEDYWNIRLDEAGNQVTERVWTTSTLQQKWAGYVSTGPLKIDVEYSEEWRDVPIEKEPKQ